MFVQNLAVGRVLSKHMQTPCQSLPAAKSGHIYLEILVGLVWPRVFVCPPPPSKLGAQPFPIFCSSSVSLLTPSTLEGGARSNYQETQHSNFQEKCGQGGRSFWFEVQQFCASEGVTRFPNTRRIESVHLKSNQTLAIVVDSYFIIK